MQVVEQDHYRKADRPDADVYHRKEIQVRVEAVAHLGLQLGDLAHRVGTAQPILKLVVGGDEGADLGHYRRCEVLLEGHVIGEVTGRVRGQNVKGIDLRIDGRLKGSSV